MIIREHFKLINILYFNGVNSSVSKTHSFKIPCFKFKALFFFCSILFASQSQKAQSVSTIKSSKQRKEIDPYHSMFICERDGNGFSWNFNSISNQYPRVHSYFVHISVYILNCLARESTVCIMEVLTTFVLLIFTSQQNRSKKNY